MPRASESRSASFDTDSEDASAEHDFDAVNTILKRASPKVLARLTDIYGDLLLDNASEQFLDRAMELRLMTISADGLVAMLASARRLGYEEEQVLSDEETTLQNPAEKSLNNTIPPESRLKSGNEQYPKKKFIHAACGKTFTQKGGLTYHTLNNVCKTSNDPNAPIIVQCPQCGCGFSSPATYSYHLKEVCPPNRSDPLPPHISQPARTNEVEYTQSKRPLPTETAAADDARRSFPAVNTYPPSDFQGATRQSPEQIQQGRRSITPSYLKVSSPQERQPTETQFVPSNGTSYHDMYRQNQTQLPNILPIVMDAPPQRPAPPPPPPPPPPPLPPAGNPLYRGQGMYPQPPQLSQPLLPDRSLFQRQDPLFQRQSPRPPHSVIPRSDPPPSSQSIILDSTPSRSQTPSQISASDNPNQLIAPSSLDPESRAIYEQEMAEALTGHDLRIAELDENDYEYGEKVTKLKQILATKKTSIRKKFGLRARIRRSSKLPHASNSPDSAGGRLAEFRAPTASMTSANPDDSSKYHPAPVLASMPDPKRRRVSNLPREFYDPKERSPLEQPNTGFSAVNSSHQSQVPLEMVQRPRPSSPFLEFDPEVKAHAREISMRNPTNTTFVAAGPMKKVPLPPGVQANWESLQPRTSRTEPTAPPAIITKAFTPINHVGLAPRPAAAPSSTETVEKRAQESRRSPPKNSGPILANDDSPDSSSADEDIPAKRTVAAGREGRNTLTGIHH